MTDPQPSSSGALAGLQRYLPSVLTVVLALTVVVLIYGYVLRVPCNHNPWVGQQYTGGCYNDIQAIFGDRGLQRSDPFPYVHGHLVGGRFHNGAYEYPVLTGVFIWAVALVSNTSGIFLIWTALLLGSLAVLTAFMLTSLVGWRALYWAAAPTLALYAFYNWDVLAVCAAVAGFLAWQRGRYGSAGALLAVGASFKLFPAFFLLPMLLERLCARDRRGAERTIGAALSTTLFVNVPFVILNPSGWWIPWRYQSTRGVDANTLWSLAFPQMSGHAVNLVSGALTLASFATALALGYRSAHRGLPFPVLQVSAAMVVTFMLWGKVDSLQYMLWVLPFFALLDVRPGWWVGFVAADLTLYWGYFRSLHDGGRYGAYSISHQALFVGAWWRIGMLALLAVVFLRSTTAIDHEIARSQHTVPSPAPATSR